MASNKQLELGSVMISIVVASLTLALLMNVSRAQNAPQDFLVPHNAARANVSVGPMTWDTTLAAYALNYANQRAKDCKLIHSDGPYGENIAWGSSATFSAGQAVNLWVAEKHCYNYATNLCQGGECLHYTQVVWRDSVRLGCARVTCSGAGGTFVICSYDYPGNWEGERPY
ncbi:Allergen V5/Tpx-1-related [Macleaya cordata]|uniref:Allergen V5/Tpx-1-related n=1 Tax=Macleaya cordata TaxID=56857 RepID=A0A200Q5K4_MACCD|nr:Allergen V5/Tpx-1-related [Macleaya cordata]